MNLRHDIHTAIDEVAPPAPHLPTEVVKFIFADNADRRASRNRRGGWTNAFQALGSIAAAALIVTLMAGLVAAGWWLRGAVNRPAPIDQAQLAQLEERPLNLLPPLKAGEPCPEGSYTSWQYGNGPVYILSFSYGTSTTATSWGTYWHGTIKTDADLTGLVLVRGRDLRTNQPVVFVGQFASGPVAGKDTVDGKTVQQHLDLVLDTSHPPYARDASTPIVWPMTPGLASGESGCTGWQFDGPALSEVIVTSHVPAG